MDAVRLESYSRALAEEFVEDADTVLVLNRLVRSPREEYEAKIPEMGTLLGMVRAERGERRRREREEAERQEWEALEEDRKAHPENYCTLEDVFDAYNARQAAKRTLPAEATA